MTFLSSATNPKIQRVRALLERHKTRLEEQAYVVEGVRLAEEALRAQAQVELVLYTSLLSQRGVEVVREFEKAGAETAEVHPRLLVSIAGTETPQGILAVIHQQQAILPQPLNFVLIADTLRDPGNLGTLLRSAAAAGAQAALLSPGSADAYSPKVLRAGMGAHFRLPVLHLTWEEIRALCKDPPASALSIYLAEASGGMVCWKQDLTRPVAILVGGEADGASQEARALSDHTITIPMPGKSESLNAAVAASILLFEVVRQRSR